MEVEIKLNFNGKEDYERALSLFATPIETDHQTNTYFTDKLNLLQQNKVMCRLRRTGKESVLTVKTAGSVEHGIQRVPEIECTIDESIADQIMDKPELFFTLDNEPVNHVKQSFPTLSDLSILGSFQNVRQKVAWTCPIGDGIPLILEFDHSIFPTFERYMLEIETDHPEEVLGNVEELFTSNQIPTTRGTEQKMVLFMRSLSESQKRKEV
ncbi:hypothetical protein BLNAU_14833 [Blattamonas nauphoetae]|uniref:CYTH domain-containing protein n=1 Tax=Blattamonas nauphoetae TaxID=2049346 RepID=A0ABQ9XFQ6_9EUKA|nr:hypothetical protein BLNAU_14833 [Blattamonas nauphoetae]